MSSDDSPQGDLHRRHKSAVDDQDIMIEVKDTGPDEWQCIECGHVVSAEDVRFGKRPSKCPDCNCVDSDTPPGTRLFIPREACGWFE